MIEVMLKDRSHQLVGVWYGTFERCIIADKSFIHQFNCSVHDGMIEDVESFTVEGVATDFSVDLPISLSHFVDSFAKMLKRAYQPSLPPTRRKLNMLWRRMIVSQFIILHDEVTGREEVVENQSCSCDQIVKHSTTIECSFLYFPLYKQLLSFDSFIFDERYERFVVFEQGKYFIRTFKNLLSFSAKTMIELAVRENELLFDIESVEFVNYLTSLNEYSLIIVEEI